MNANVGFDFIVFYVESRIFRILQNVARNIFVETAELFCAFQKMLPNITRVCGFMCVCVSFFLSMPQCEGRRARVHPLPRAEPTRKAGGLPHLAWKSRRIVTENYASCGRRPQVHLE